MFDPAAIVGFDWDAGNERKSADKHGVSQGEAEQVFSISRCWFSKTIVTAWWNRVSMRSARPMRDDSCASRSPCAGTTR